MRWDRNVKLADLPANEKGIGFEEWAVEMAKRECVAARRHGKTPKPVQQKVAAKKVEVVVEEGNLWEGIHDED